MKTMVVDDEVVSRKKMRQIMRNFSTCLDMTDGTTAVGAFQDALKAEDPFEIIILDLEMPGMDGIEVLRRIRAIEQAMKIGEPQKVKVVMATANAEKETVLKCVQAGCDNYIVKPFTKEKVYDKLRTLGYKL